MVEVRLIDKFSGPLLKRAAELYLCAHWIDELSQGDFIAGALRGSAAVAGAFDRGELVGIGRVISDGCSDGYVQDVVVDPGFRGQGVGSRMIRLLARTMYDRGVTWLALVGEPGTEGFYAALGLKAEPGFTMWRFPEEKSSFLPD